LIVGISLVPVEKTLANQRLGTRLNERARHLRQAQNGPRPGKCPNAKAEKPSIVSPAGCFGKRSRAGARRSGWLRLR
jgi:hypothetical protein